MTLTQALTAIKEGQALSPITLFEIDLSESQDMFTSIEAGIWRISLTVLGEPFRFGDFWTDADDYNTTLLQISSITVNDGTGEESYSEVTSLANLRTQNKSFLWDDGEQTLYIHFDNFDPWWVFTSIRLGVTYGYSEIGYHNGTVFFPPALQPINAITSERDRQFFGVQRYKDVNIKLSNDGSFDTLAKENLYGQPCRCKIGFSEIDYSEFKTVFTGVINNIPTAARDQVSIQAIDKRKLLSVSIPESRFDATTYPDMADDYIGKPIPIIFGDCRGVKAFPTDEEASVTNYTFKVCDMLDYSTISSIGNIKVDGTSVTAVSTSLTTGTFTLASADVDDDFGKVTCDVVGYVDGSVIENGLDVIKELIRYYSGEEYISDNYNTTEWASEQTDAPDIGLYIDDRTELIKIIGEIARSCFGLFLIETDGKYTFRTSDWTGSSSRAIVKDEIIGDIKADYDSEEFLTSVEVKYYKDYDSDDYRTTTYDTDEDTIYDKYKTKRHKAFETLLTTKAEADTLAEDWQGITDQIRPVFTITTALQSMNVKLLDVLTANIDRQFSAWYGDVKAEIQSISIKPADGTVTMKCKYIEPDTDLYFLLGDAISDMVLGDEGADYIILGDA